MCRARQAGGLVLMMYGLLAFTGCAAIGEYLSQHVAMVPGTDAPREADCEMASRADDSPRSTLLTETTRLHVVRAGETLNEIAVHYRILASDLYALNPIPDPDRIEVGQRLSLPAHAVVPSRPMIARMGRPAPTRAQILMTEAEAAYQAARFERALALSQEARALMEAESDRSKQLAHAAFLSGSALAGLGEDQRASEEFERVHFLDAQFEPPDGWLSPRLGSLYGDSLAK